MSTSHEFFSCTHRVSYSECTVGNHVYHSRFLDFLERARGELFRSLNCSVLQLQEEGVIFPVTHCEMRFRAMARYDDVLTVDLWLTELGRTRFSCASRIRNASETVLHEAVIRLACTDLQGKPCRLPVGLAEALKRYVAPMPEGEPQA